MLVLDAFSGDAPPAHLLTREAFGTYLAHLRQPGGIIAVNISTNALDLQPVVQGLADYFRLLSVLVAVPAPQDGIGLASRWVLLSRDVTFMRDPAIVSAASAARSTRQVALWTDERHSLFPLLR